MGGYHEQLEPVEATHWWFVALRELVRETLLERSPPPGRVLDVGCSTGHLLAALPDAYDRVGVDVSEAAVRHAAQRRPAIRFEVASIERLPFADGEFDVALATDVVSAVGVDDDAAALGELRRVTRPGGLVVVQVAAYEWLRSGHDLAAGTARRYTARSLRGRLAAAGLQPLRVSYRVTLPFPLAAAWRLARRGRPASDVAPVDPRLNRALARVMGAERALLRQADLPFGLSVFALARAGR